MLIVRSSGTSHCSWRGGNCVCAELGSSQGGQPEGVRTEPAVRRSVSGPATACRGAVRWGLYWHEVTTQNESGCDGIWGFSRSSPLR